MSPRTDEQFEKIREERKMQIMEVALKLISEDGFGKVSIANISKEANISKGLMYNYFKSKEDLIMEILLAGFEELTSVFDPNKNDTLSKEELHFFIDKMFEVLNKNIRFYRMYFMVILQPEVMKIIEPVMMEIIGKFMDITYKYFASNGYEDPESEMRIFAGLMDGIGLHFVMDPRHYPLEGVRKILHRMYS